MNEFEIRKLKDVPKQVLTRINRHINISRNVPEPIKERPGTRPEPIKTRKGSKSGWTQSSAIPKIIGNECPTHFLFVHLNDDYSIQGMWLFDWDFLTKNERFRKHMVRGNLRSYIFHLNETKDQDHKIFPNL